MKKLYFFLSLLSFGLLVGQRTEAICPLCTVAVGAGVGFSRWIGIDDIISGIWIGGLIVSMIMWLLDYLDQKKLNFYLRNLTIVLAFYLLTLLPLFYTNIIGHPLNKIWGIDRILFGIVIGTITFLLGALAYKLSKKKNNGKPYFPYQKVVFPVSFLAVISLITYYLLKW
ncbi:MAG: hypothetical protein WC845_03600 [Candidatus Staskawiczbacteria bacterium]|jgi:hypothetical protein